MAPHRAAEPILGSTGDGTRTRTPLARPRILSPPRLPFRHPGKGGEHSAATAPPHRFVSPRLLSLLAAAALLFVTVAADAEEPAPRELSVYFVDVGQGDATLIRSPGGKTVLLDAGGPAAGSAVRAHLARLGVERIDLAISSHPHLDHLGGMLEVLEAYPPAMFLDPAVVHPLPQYDRLLGWLESAAIPVRTARGGRTITLEEGIRLSLLWPSEPLLTGTRSDVNANSVVALLTFGEVSFLLAADAEAVTEKHLLAAKPPLPLQATVLKVAHHGGRHSTTARWLDRVKPQFAVISCGAVNGYGHPHPETLARLENRRIRVFRTDRDGDVIARTDGSTLRWETTGSASARLDEPEGIRSYDGRPVRGEGAPKRKGSRSRAAPSARTR